MKTTLLLILCILGAHSFAQSSLDEPQNVQVNWKVGTTKTITQTDSTIIQSNGSVFMATGSTASYRIKIVSLKDTVYEVLFKQTEMTDEISIESEVMDATPIEKMIQEIIQEIQKEMSELEYSFLVDKNTAFAYEVKNEQKLMDFIEETVLLVINKLVDQTNLELEDSKKKELQEQIKEYMEDEMPAAIQSMLNNFNYLFQAYSFPYILDQTYTQDVEVQSIDQVQHGDKEQYAQLIVNSSLSKEVLKIDYKYIYDKEEAYQMYVVAEGKEDEISLEDFDMDERVISEFDMASSWIKTSNSAVYVKMGDITVNNKTSVTIK